LYRSCFEKEMSAVWNVDDEDANVGETSK
jgi:hypothetical protein